MFSLSITICNLCPHLFLVPKYAHFEEAHHNTKETMRITKIYSISWLFLHFVFQVVDRIMSVNELLESQGIDPATLPKFPTSSNPQAKTTVRDLRP